MMRAVETRGQRQLIAAERILRKFLLVGVCGAVSCSDATGPADVDNVVASVTVTPPASTITVGAELPLQVIVQDAAGRTITDAPIVWSVRDPDIASVSSSGVVTGLAVGATQIAANTAGRSAIATITVQRVPVASVVVRPAIAAVTTGGLVQFTAAVYDANQNALTDRSITWSSSNEAVATVNSSGMATAVAAGVATITATSEVRSGAATLTVSLVPVATVEVTPNPVTISVGQATQLTAAARDAGGVVLPGRNATWSSSNANVATVSDQGIVSALTAGTAFITATIEGKFATATVTVTAVPVATVTVTPGTATVSVQGSVTLSATTRDAAGNTLTGRAVTWTTNAPTVATVSSSGVVTGVAPGTAVITATSEGKSGTATVTVALVPVATVTVTPGTATVLVQGSVTLSATTRDAAGNTLTGRAVTWTTNAPTVATVSSSGGVTAVVTGVAPGTATITATSEGRSGTATVIVTLAPVATVTVEPSTATVASGSTTTLTAKVTDQNGGVLTNRVVTWSSNNPSVATVSSTGVITAVVTGALVGTATITASAEGKSGSASVTITPGPITSVRVTPTSTSLPIGTKVDLTAAAFDAAGNPISGVNFTWASSNPAIASVSVDGEVNAKKEGTVTISAITAGTSGSATVTVTK